MERPPVTPPRGLVALLFVLLYDTLRPGLEALGSTAGHAVRAWLVECVFAMIPMYGVGVHAIHHGGMWLHTAKQKLIMTRDTLPSDPDEARRFGHRRAPTSGLVMWRGSPVYARVVRPLGRPELQVWAPTHFGMPATARAELLSGLREEVAHAANVCSGGMLLVIRGRRRLVPQLENSFVHSDEHGGRDPIEDPLKHQRPVETQWLPSYQPVAGVILRDNLDDTLLSLTKRYLERESESRAARRVFAILLVGEPGVGKTSRAQRLAFDLGRPLLVLDTAQVGDVSHRPSHGDNAVEFIDELDRDLLACQPRERHARVRDMLVYLDGATNRGATVLVAACNSLVGIDPALLRRFHVVHVEPPVPEKFWRLFCDNYGLSVDDPLVQEFAAGLAPAIGKVSLRELALHMRWHDDPAQAIATLSTDLLTHYTYARSGDRD